MWLSEQDIARLTRKKRPSAQIRQLALDGVPFRVVAGRPIVMEADLREQKRVKALPAR